MPSILIDGLDPLTRYEIRIVPIDIDGNRFDCLPILTLSAGS